MSRRMHGVRGFTLVEMVTIRAIPAVRAREISASSSPAKSGKSRWQWLSISIRVVRFLRYPHSGEKLVWGPAGRRRPRSGALPRVR